MSPSGHAIWHDDPVLFDSTTIDLDAFTAATGWQIKPEGACKGGICVPLGTDRDPLSVAERLGMAVVTDDATGNVAIDKTVLQESGLFDPSFQLYGWEDLELGERLRRMGVRLVRCPAAAGYHWHPPLNLEQVPELVRKERERAKMGLVFYKKHPTRRVRFIIQFTIWHRLLWELLTLGGLINERSLRPLLRWLIRNGYPGTAMELLRLPLNRIGVRVLFREARSAGLR